MTKIIHCVCLWTSKRVGDGLLNNALTIKDIFATNDGKRITDLS